MNNKIFYSIILLLALATTTVYAQDFQEITVPLSNPNIRGMLKVEIHKGPIKVIGTARKDILIKYKELHKKHKPKIKEGKNGLKKIAGGNLNLEISERENRVRVESESWNQGIILEIEVPKEMDLKLETYNEGDIVVENIDGAMELTSYNGPIKALNISGTLLADTYNGKITASFSKVTPGEPMALTNYNGGMDLTFPEDIAATLKISNKQGDIYTGFDVKLQQQTIEPTKSRRNNFNVKIGEWIIGKINGGGAEITLENHNGDIYIRKPEKE